MQCAGYYKLGRLGQCNANSYFLLAMQGFYGCRYESDQDDHQLPQTSAQTGAPSLGTLHTQVTPSLLYTCAHMPVTYILSGTYNMAHVYGPKQKSRHIYIDFFLLCVPLPHAVLSVHTSSVSVGSSHGLGMWLEPRMRLTD